MLESGVMIVSFNHDIIVMRGNKPLLARLPPIKVAMLELTAAAILVQDLNRFRVANVREQCRPSGALYFELCR